MKLPKRPRVRGILRDAGTVRVFHDQARDQWGLAIIEPGDWSQPGYCTPFYADRAEAMLARDRYHAIHMARPYAYYARRRSDWWYEKRTLQEVVAEILKEIDDPDDPFGHVL